MRDQIFDNTLPPLTRRAIEDLCPLVPDLHTRLVSQTWLAGLDGEQFALGAHGHEHQRYAMMDPRWQRQDLGRNLDLLRQFRAFRPVFALPFGRPIDWTPETLRVAEESGVDVVFADGGINLPGAFPNQRVPADNLAARDVTRMAMR